MAQEQLLVQGSGIWKTKALDRHVSLGLDYRKMIGWYDAVMEHVRESWLADQARKKSMKVHTLADAHPLYRFLHEGSDIALIHICELGQYIQAFESDPAMPETVKDLISPKFQSTLFELAMAYRWQRAGGKVTLHAPAAGKRVADFGIVLNEVPFLVEASNISTELFDQLSFRAPLLIQRAALPALREGSVLLVKFVFRSVPSGTWEQKIRTSVTECCSELDRLRNSGKPLRVSKENDEHSIEVEQLPSPDRSDPLFLRMAGAELDFQDRKDWDACFNHLTGAQPRELRLRILIRFPPGPPNSAPGILKKLHRETRQLRGVRAARIVLLDISGVEADALRLNAEALRQGLIQELSGIPELASVWLVSRGWSTERRYQYRGQFIANPESSFQLPVSFLQNFVRNEWCCDFLGEKQLVHDSEEDAMRRFLAREPNL
jgi:hypothetical protein